MHDFAGRMSRNDVARFILNEAAVGEKYKKKIVAIAV